jgi:Flp pilus assembly protein TadD
MGTAYLRLGKLTEAERNLRSAARLNADSSSIYEHLGDLLKVKKEAQAARSAWMRALRLSFGQAESDRLRGKLGN